MTNQFGTGVSASLFAVHIPNGAWFILAFICAMIVVSTIGLVVHSRRLGKQGVERRKALQQFAEQHGAKYLETVDDCPELKQLLHTAIIASKIGNLNGHTDDFRTFHVSNMLVNLPDDYELLTFDCCSTYSGKNSPPSLKHSAVCAAFR